MEDMLKLLTGGKEAIFVGLPDDSPSYEEIIKSAEKELLDMQKSEGIEWIPPQSYDSCIREILTSMNFSGEKIDTFLANDIPLPLSSQESEQFCKMSKWIKIYDDLVEKAFIKASGEARLKMGL